MIEIGQRVKSTLASNGDNAGVTRKLPAQSGGGEGWLPEVRRLLAKHMPCPRLSPDYSAMP